MKPLTVKLSLLAGATVIYGLLGATAAQAARFESRDFNPGDGLITYDSVLGLEWLDLSVTAGRAYNYIETGYGGRWRNPNSTEITSLQQYFSPNGPLSEFQNYFGVVSSNSFARYSYGFTGGSVLVNGQPQYRFIGNLYYLGIQQTSFLSDRLQTATTKFTTGVFLVRPYTPPTTTLLAASFAAPALASVSVNVTNSQSVPEPLTIGGALMALSFGTYFKKKCNGKNTSKDPEI